MKRLAIALICITTLSSDLFSQNNIDSILTEVEKNNTNLSALRKHVEAEKIGNKTGIYLQNPEFEFAYLWGKPSVIGNRTNISITQSFDFPTAYRYKKQIANIKNEQVELEYQKQLKSLLLQTRFVCYELIYTNALKQELSKRLIHAESIAKSYTRKFDIGETNILEYNKAQLNFLTIRKEMESIEIERNVLSAELTILNGGIVVNYSDSIFESPVLSEDFEQWYLSAEESNPVLNWLKQEVEKSKKQEKLKKAMGLPKLHAGYMSEKVAEEQFQGITVGISIPLWENKNTVKYAKANTIAIESIRNDNKLQFYNKLKALHFKVISMQKSVDDYRKNLQSYNNSELLKKALDMGEISMIDYILELTIYYDSFNKLLELEKEVNKSLAELNQYL